MPNLLWKRKKLLIKIEPTPGEDSAPDATDLINTRNAQPDPYTGEFAEWDYDTDELGSKEQINVNPGAAISFEVGFQGSGVVGTPPQWGVPARISGFSETIHVPTAITAITQALPAQVTEVGHGYVDGDYVHIAGVVGMTEVNDLSYKITVVDVDNYTLDGIDSTGFTGYTSDGTGTTGIKYELAQGNFETASIHYYQDIQRHRMLGAMSNMTINAARGTDLPTFGFPAQAQYERPTVPVALSASVPEIPPFPFTKENTPVVSFGGYAAACVQSFSLDLGNVIVRNNMPNCDNTMLTDRAITGQIAVEAVDVDTKDYFADLESHNGVTIIPFQLIHGIVPGHIIELKSDEIQLSSVAMSDTDGQTIYTMDFRIMRSEFEMITR